MSMWRCLRRALIISVFDNDFIIGLQLPSETRSRTQNLQLFGLCGICLLAPVAFAVAVASLRLICECVCSHYGRMIEVSARVASVSVCVRFCVR